MTSPDWFRDWWLAKGRPPGPKEPLRDAEDSLLARRAWDAAVDHAAKMIGMVRVERGRSLKGKRATTLLNVTLTAVESLSVALPRKRRPVP